MVEWLSVLLHYLNLCYINHVHGHHNILSHLGEFHYQDNGYLYQYHEWYVCVYISQCYQIRNHYLVEMSGIASYQSSLSAPSSSIERIWRINECQIIIVGWLRKKCSRIIFVLIVHSARKSISRYAWRISMHDISKDIQYHQYLYHKP